MNMAVKNVLSIIIMAIGVLKGKLLYIKDNE